MADVVDGGSVELHAGLVWSASWLFVSPRVNFYAFSPAGPALCV